MFFSSGFSQTTNQWAGSTTIEDNLYRNGNVGIGLETARAILHVYKNETTGDVAVYPNDGRIIPYTPNIRIQTFFEDIDGQPVVDHFWDIDVGGGFLLRNGSGQETDLSVTAMNLTNYGMTLNGSSLIFGKNEKTFSGKYMSSPISGNGYFLGLGVGTMNNVWSFFEGRGGGAIQADDSGNLLFITKPNNGTKFIGSNSDKQDLTHMLINSAGNVGIGTVTPSKLLTLSADEPVLRFDADGGISSWEVSASQDGKLKFNGGTDLSTFMTLHENGKLTIGTDLHPDMIGGSDGDDISAYTIYAEGGILTKEVRVREDWSDYVFKEDYNLLPLEEVEENINEVGHLHNTPSAEEVESNGLNLGQMMANQQEKIEELFLYIIDLNKQIKALQMENKNLKEIINK